METRTVWRLQWQRTAPGWIDYSSWDYETEAEAREELARARKAA